MDENPPHSKKYRRITIFTVALVILLLLRFSMSGEDAGFEKIMRHTAAELNKTCPQQVDHDTRLDSASALSNKTFRYNYTLQFPKDSIEVEMLVLSVKPLMLNNVRTNADLQLFRENDVIFEYYFKDQHGEFLTRITISPEEYLK
jgi:hypothetical protein